MDTSYPNQLFVLTRGMNTKLCRIQDSRIVDLAPMSFPAGGYFSISDSGWIACITKKGRSISIARLESNEKLIHFANISLPEKYRARAIAVVENILYVGGYCGEELLLSVHLTNEQKNWVSLDVPSNLKRVGKSIDDLLIDGKKLVAVDNIVFPKWLLVYDITLPKLPKLECAKEIPDHGTYEHIVMGAVGTNWIALLSSTAGQAGVGRHIAIFDKNSMKECFCLSRQPSIYSIMGRDSNELMDEQNNWNGIAFLDDLLMISSGKRGIGILDLSNIQKPSASTKEKEWNGEKHLHYVLPHNLPEGNVLRVIPYQSTKEIIVEMNVLGGNQAIVLTKNDLFP